MNMKYTATKSRIGMTFSRIGNLRTSLEFSRANEAIVKSRACEELITRLPIEKNIGRLATPLNSSPAVIKAMMRNARPRVIRALMYLSGR